MLGALPPFDYHRPSSLQEALAILERLDGKVCPYAGGTDLLVALKEGKARHQALMDIKSIPELGAVRQQDGGLCLGAAITTRVLARSALMRERFPILAQALKLFGSMQIGNRATLGGNLCNASPAADSAPPLLTLDARVKLVGPRGQRSLSLAEFFLGPNKTAVSCELLTEIQIPQAPASGRSVFLKLGPRGAPEDIAIVSVAVFAGAAGMENRWRDVRIALGAVAPTPIRARHAEEILRDQPVSEEGIQEASRLAAESDAQPISDDRASARYRRSMVEVLLKRALEHIASELRQEAAR
jgi:carbon-monoxide dehydrogenase medium subunit